jgi:hypothetical protein
VFQMPNGGCHPVCWVLPRLGSTLRFDLDARSCFTPTFPPENGEPSTARTHTDFSDLRAVHFIKLNCDGQQRVMGYFQP